MQLHISLDEEKIELYFQYEYDVNIMDDPCEIFCNDVEQYKD